MNISNFSASRALLISSLEIDRASKEMAIMFSDMRSFTTMAERMTPQENFDFLNTYLQRSSPKIRKHNGFIVKYMGDGVMAVFPDGVHDAIQAGIVKLEQLQKYNQSRKINGYIPLNTGIGIHVSDTMVGLLEMRIGCKPMRCPIVSISPLVWKV